MAKQLTIDKVNDMVRYFDERGVQVPTKLKYISDSFPQIVIARGERVGEVRTYDETVKFLKRIYKNEALIPSMEEYISNVNTLFKELQEFHFYNKGFYLISQRNDMQQKIKWACEATGRSVKWSDINKLNTYQLLEIFRAANDASSAKGNSDEFYTVLLDELEKAM